MGKNALKMAPMKKEKLDRHLTSSSPPLYGVLDGSSVPDLPTRLYESRLPNHCLFQGDLDPDLAHVAPYLVFLPPNHEFTEWVFSEGFGDDWGVFIHSHHSLIEMRRHFRSLTNVYGKNGSSMIFRFYDPRVLRQYLPTCTPDELQEFFGGVERIFAETEEGDGLISFELENNVLKQTELN